MVMASFLPEEDPMIPPRVTYLTFPVQKTNTPIPRRGINPKLQIPNSKQKKSTPKTAKVKIFQF
jgi:hypothetical protein